MKPTADEPQVARVPEGMIFPITANGPVEMSVNCDDGDSYRMLVGGVAPLSGAANRKYPGLNFRHLRVMLRILFGRKFDSPEVPMNLRDLIPGRSADGRTYECLQDSINDLAGAWIHVIREGRPVQAMSLMELKTEIIYFDGVNRSDIDQISDENNIKGRRVKKAIFAYEFWKACLNWERCWPVRADVVDLMTSDVAAGSYLVLAPNTHAKGVQRGQQLRKDARTILKRIGYGKADTMPNYEIVRTFQRVRGRTPSVLTQMNQQPMLRDVFRVAPELELNSGGNGYNVIYWREAEPTPAESEESFEKNNKLFSILVDDLGLPADVFLNARKTQDAEIQHYEVDELLSVGYQIGQNRRYLSTVRSFIGPTRFMSAIASIKVASRETRIADIGKYVGATMREAFIDWAKAYKAGGAGKTLR